VHLERVGRSQPSRWHRRDHDADLEQLEHAGRGERGRVSDRDRSVRVRAGFGRARKIPRRPRCAALVSPARGGSDASGARGPPAYASLRSLRRQARNAVAERASSERRGHDAAREVHDDHEARRRPAPRAARRGRSRRSVRAESRARARRRAEREGQPGGRAPRLRRGHRSRELEGRCSRNRTAALGGARGTVKGEGVMAGISGNALAAQALRAEGAEGIFYLAGGPMFDVMWESMRLGMRAIHTRHEQGAAMMAHGYARASGKVGLVNTSSGPGTINASTGMVNALLDAAPIILLAGASPLRTRDLEDFQEVDQVGAMRPLSKWAVQVHEARRIPEYVAAAYRKALGNRPGPVHLALPGDVVYSEVPEDKVVWSRSPRPARVAADPDAVRDAIKLLKAAERPLVISGSGVLWSDASRELEAFIERTHIPFFTTPQGRGVVPDDHPLAFLNARSTAFRDADVLLVVGTRFNVILGFGRSPRF